MTIWYKHVHGLELQKFFFIFVLRIYQLSEIPDFLFRRCKSEIRKTEISSLYLT